MGQGKHYRRVAGLAIWLGIVAGSLAQVASRPQPEPIFRYITQTWTELTRSIRDLPKAAVDPKFPTPPDGKWPVYVPRSEKLDQIKDRLEQQLKPAGLRTIELRSLPDDVPEHGLLFLPRPYVVPGGRFNEMYGWDSFFIQLGLLRDGRVELARDMADNFLYEIREYGKILNANRTYHLTRSQPPFLTQMLLGVFRKTKNREWLKDALPAVEKYYRFWTSEPHVTNETGLSRYFDIGDGPSPEAVAAERDADGRTHYDRAKEYLRTHSVEDYDVSLYYNREKNELTPLFYKGDRSVRESGFDPSNRYGPFSVDIIHYNPVCLNSLLYAMEVETAEILRILGRDTDSKVWEARARQRGERVNRLMWSAADGLYFDYDFKRRKIRKYPFLSTFYPLWAGFASHEQAARVAANLPKFERPGGLQTSTTVSGSQWDAPFGWAPLHLIAIQGLRRYGFHDAADRISRNFLSLVKAEYLKSGTIVEKYDVVRRTSDVSSGVRFGYSSNERGFGWTNSAYEVLTNELGEKGGKLGRWSAYPLTSTCAPPAITNRNASTSTVSSSRERVRTQSIHGCRRCSLLG